MAAQEPAERPQDLVYARGLVEHYVPKEAADREARERILGFVDEHPDALFRTCLEGHLTGSALLLDHEGRRCLLHHHRKLDRWLQFGGHADGEGNLASVAWRETEEESGIRPARLSEVVDVDVHAIPARGDEPEHWHLDVRFVAWSPVDAEAVISSESKALAWLTPEEALERCQGDSLGRLVRMAFGMG